MTAINQIIWKDERVREIEHGKGKERGERFTFNIAMQFSQIVSLVLAAETRSGIKLRHLTGQSCFKIYKLLNKKKFHNVKRK